MNRITILSMLVVTGLAGCGGLTPQRDKTSGPPSNTFTSAKSPAVVADCIARRWPTSLTVAGGGGQPAVTRSTLPGGGVELMLKVGPQEDHMARVEAAGSGSTTGVWTLGTYFGGTPQQVVAARECQ